MSALYLGTGKLEQFLVEKLSNKIKSSDDLRVNLLFDYMRGTRFNREGQSSLNMLKQIKIEQY